MPSDSPVTSGAAAAAMEYDSRLRACQSQLDDLRRTDQRFVRFRLAAFALLVCTVFVCFGDESVSWWWILIPASVFTALVLIHAGTIRKLKRADAASEFYQHARQRLTSEWKTLPDTGQSFSDAAHSWSQDLDLFGQGSLFQKMNQCRTLPGRRRLASWMTTVPSVEVLRRRQRQAESLRNDLDLRERLAVIDEKGRWDAAEAVLTGWIAESARPIPAWILSLSSLLGILGALVLLLVLLALIPWTIVLLVLVLQAPLIWLTRAQIKSVAGVVDNVDSSLRQLSAMIREFEQHSFSEPSLQDLQRQFSVAGHSASAEIRHLSNLIAWLNNALRNQLFAPVAWMCGLLVVLTHRIETWRDRHGARVADWLEAAATLEALISVGAFNFDNSDFCLPNCDDSAPLFSAQQLGHPLLPREECVRNDVDLTVERPLLLISGSNMSGKSTLLRSIGINTVLAFCGSRTNAASLTTYPFQIGTAMRVSDSLQEGRSLFFSVVQRLKSVVDLTSETRPVLFLLDEILHGTNSHDRRHGAEAVIRTLVARGGLGLVTTHDLALTQIVDTMDGRAANMHFEDQIIDGSMSFDYQLRPGVVQRSNAIELMRMMGLDV
ncbi:MAG: hypothetical protein R3C19_17730 [Planctomycetaceae bacterium]